MNAVIAAVVRRPAGRPDFGTRLGRALVRPLVGIPVLALTLYVMYEVIGVFVAGTVVGFTEGTVMQGYVEPFLRGAIEQVTGSSGVAYSILAGEFGVVTMTVTYIFGLLLPLVVAFYLLMSTLEDSGYLPRIAALSDRLMTGIGLNGRAIIPMILGFGCITMATMTTRILGNERERRIATALMAFAIPCSAQLGVVVALLAAAGGGTIAIAYGAIMVLIFGVHRPGLDRVLPGKSTDLLIDLPPLRLPRPRNVLTKTYHKTVMFLKEVSLYFVAGALLLSILEITGALAALQGLLAPLTVGWLGTPGGGLGRLRDGLRAARLRRRRPLRPGPHRHADPRRPRDHHVVRAVHRLGADHHQGTRPAVHRRRVVRQRRSRLLRRRRGRRAWPGSCEVARRDPRPRRSPAACSPARSADCSWIPSRCAAPAASPRYRWAAAGTAASAARGAVESSTGARRRRLTRAPGRAATDAVRDLPTQV